MDMFFGNANNMICNITCVVVNISILKSLSISIIDFVMKIVVISFIVQPDMSAKRFCNSFVGRKYKQNLDSYILRLAQEKAHLLQLEKWASS